MYLTAIATLIITLGEPQHYDIIVVVFTYCNYLLSHYNNFQVQTLRVSLEDARTNGDRLHRESELVVENVNSWVKEQK